MSRFSAQVRALLLSSMIVATPSIAADSTPHAGEVPISAFARHASIGQPSLSPDGKYLSVDTATDNGENHTLVIYRLADMKVLSLLKMPKYELPLDVEWVSNTRLIIQKGILSGALGKPASLGEVITTDINGKHQDYLYGPKPYGSRSEIRGIDRGWGWIAGLPEKLDDTFYLQAKPWSGGDKRSMLYRVNARNSARHLIGEIDTPDLNFVVGHDGRADFAYGIDPTYHYVIYHRWAQDRWSKLPSKQTGDQWEPIDYSPDYSHIYVSWSKSGGPLQLTSFDADGKLGKVLAKSDFGDIGDIEWTAPPARPFAAIPATGLPRPIIIDPKAPEAKLYLALLKAFPGQSVRFIDYSKDGHMLLFLTVSDRNPGTYYLINRSTGKVRKLFDIAGWLPRSEMAQRQVAHFKAKDGTELEAILTLPPHRQAFKLPMVLLPHGGPMASSTWIFDDMDDYDAQLLANRGYLVLQVNFRGSTGRGPDFERAVYRHWGTTAQQDLVDAVHWAIKEAYADPNRICTYGASFGGYSALMSVIRAPKLFKCAIGYDGVYDLAMQRSKSDTHLSEQGRSYLDVALGSDPAELRANSPVFQVGKINVPVFLIHGKDDERAPYAEAVEMRDALKKAGKPVEFMARSGEGHGFYDVQNNVDRLTRILAFLKQNIGPGAPIQHQQQGQAGKAP